jgi:hypothetical protein
LWGAAFWLIAILPAIGVGVWIVLSRYQETAAPAEAARA